MHLLRLLAGLGQGGHEKRYQDGNDPDEHEQLDQRKRTTATLNCHGHTPRYRGGARRACPEKWDDPF
jgi:hypothetical protein